MDATLKALEPKMPQTCPLFRSLSCSPGPKCWTCIYSPGNPLDSTAHELGVGWPFLKTGAESYLKFMRWLRVYLFLLCFLTSLAPSQEWCDIILHDAALKTFWDVCLCVYRICFLTSSGDVSTVSLANCLVCGLIQQHGNILYKKLTSALWWPEGCSRMWETWVQIFTRPWSSPWDSHCFST